MSELNLKRPNRPDLSSIPLEVVRYIESLEYGIDKVDSMCLKHATRCDELHETVKVCIDALENCYDVVDWPVHGMTKQDKAIELAKSSIGDPDEI